MNDEQIKSFLAIAEYGSFTKAAEKRFISKQSMYKQISGLEEETGFTLFERRRTGTELTEAGRMFKEGLIPLIDARAELIISCRKAAHHDFIRIGSVEHQVILHPVNELFAVQHPEIQLIRVVHPNHSGEYRVANNIMDIGESFAVPTDEKNDNLDFDFISLAEMKYYAAMRKDHPLSGRKVLSLHDLSRYKVKVFVLMHRKIILNEIEQAFAECPDHLIYIENPDLQVETAFSLLSSDEIVIGANPFVRKIDGIVTVPLDRDWSREYGLIYARPMTSTIRKYINTALHVYHKPSLPE